MVIRNTGLHVIVPEATDDGLLAHGDPLFDGAVIADDGAAPLETALATFGPLLTDNIVASAAAQRLTVVQIGTGLVAAPAHYARVVVLRFAVTEIRRSLVEEKIRITEPPLDPPVVALHSVT